MGERRPTIVARHGMVAAAHPLAASAGACLLAQGGNAFDAAAAVGTVLNVVEPFMSGLAGLGLATMWLAVERRIRVLESVPCLLASFPLARFGARGHAGSFSGTDWTMKVGGMQATALSPTSRVATEAANPPSDGHVAVPLRSREQHDLVDHHS